MFVVFGWDKTFKQRESLLKTHCHHCGNDVSWRIWHETRMGVAVLRAADPACHEVSPRVRGVPRLAAARRAHVPQARNRHALDARASRELHDELVKRIEDHQYGGMTEGQRTYYKRTREQHSENA